jgi:hypothetical protein
MLFGIFARLLIKNSAEGTSYSFIGCFSVCWSHESQSRTISSSQLPTSLNVNLKNVKMVSSQIISGFGKIFLIRFRRFSLPRNDGRGDKTPEHDCSGHLFYFEIQIGREFCS